MNVVEKNILRALLKNGHAMEKRKLLKRFSGTLQPTVSKGILRLEESGYLVEDLTQEGWIVSIPKFMVDEALKSVSSIYVRDYSRAVEELIPKRYSTPFLITEGEHMSRYGIVKYAFCSKNKDKTDVTCFLIKNDKYTTIHLGSIYDVESLVSRFLNEVETKVGDKEFTKEYLQTILPKNIIKNRQPLKALTDYLCHIGFLKRIDYTQSTKFIRTNKNLDIITLDKVIEKPQSKIVSTSKGKGLYAYSEEDGLYPVLY